MPIKKGSNSATIALKLELLNAVKELSGKAEQNMGFWIMKRLLIHDKEFKDLIIKKYGQKGYEELLFHYSKTNLQQRQERELKEKIKQIRDEERRKIEKLKTITYAEQQGIDSTEVFPLEKNLTDPKKIKAKAKA